MKTVPGLSSSTLSWLSTEGLKQADFLSALFVAPVGGSSKQTPDNETSSERVYCQYCEDTDPNCMFCKGAHV